MLSVLGNIEFLDKKDDREHPHQNKIGSHATLIGSSQRTVLRCLCSNGWYPSCKGIWQMWLTLEFIPQWLDLLTSTFEHCGTDQEMGLKWWRKHPLAPKLGPPHRVCKTRWDSQRLAEAPKEVIFLNFYLLRFLRLIVEILIHKVWGGARGSIFRFPGDSPSAVKQHSSRGATEKWT